MNAAMLALHRQGVSIPAIARSMGTTEKDVTTTLRAMGALIGGSHGTGR